MSNEGSASNESSEHESVRAESIVSITHSLDGLSDAELIKTIDELEIEVRHLDLENQVFENFLLKNDPSLIAGMAQVLELAGKMQSQTQSTLTTSVLERRATDDSLHASSSRKTESALRFATTTSTAERGPR